MDGLLLSPLRSIYHPLFPARLVCLLGTCTEYLTLINTLKMLSPLAAGKSFLPVMPLTRCPIYTLIWLSSVHANKKKNKKNPMPECAFTQKRFSFGSDGEQLFITNQSG